MKYIQSLNEEEIQQLKKLGFTIEGNTATKNSMSMNKVAFFSMFENKTCFEVNDNNEAYFLDSLNEISQKAMNQIKMSKFTFDEIKGIPTLKDE